MQVADSIVNTNPDSAVVLLDELIDSILSEPKSTQMYYHLLSIKARDKAYIPHTSDSLILQVVQYYENKEDKKNLPEAYFYAGRICRDLGDAPQALDYFQKAVDVSDEKTDNRLTARIYNQMGTLYMYQDIYDEAIKAYKKAYQYDTITQDSTAMIFNLRNIGLAFTGNGNPDSTLNYYQKAYNQALLTGKPELINIVQIGLASLYKQLKEYNLAKKALEIPFDKLTKDSQNAVLTISADLYYQTGNFDTAYFYFNQLLGTHNIYIKQTSHLKLAEIAQKRTNYQEMLDHIHQYTFYTDSIEKLNNTETIRKVQSLYNYQLRVKENNLLRIQNTRQESWIIYILLALIILIAFIIIYIEVHKRKELQLQEQLSKLKRLKDEHYRRSFQFIEANNERIQGLEAQLANSTEQNSALQALLQAQKEKIIQTNYQIASDRREHELSEIAFRQSAIYNHFQIAANDDNIKVSKEDWSTLQEEIDNYYKNFTSRLRALYPVSDIEMQICLLLKMNMATRGIAKLTGRSKSAIVSARKKLYEKIHGEEGKPEQWDAFIAAF